MARNGHKIDGSPISLEEATRTIKTVEASATQREAAATLGISVRGLQQRITKIERRHGLKASIRSRGPIRTSADAPAIQIPDFPDADIPIEEIIKLQSARFKKRQASFEAHTWFPVTVKENRPIGVMWFGDPHVDDNGCNWPVLERHVEICRTVDGIYGVNIGDTTNNWAGRLVRLYAEQDTSVSTARRLAEWLMLESGVTWLVFLLGNHDAWGDGSAILMQMAKRFGTHKLVMHDWEARFSLKFPNGWEPRIFTSHNFKGSSIWNPMHGPMREGQLGEDADLYICGHLHSSGLFTFENVARGRTQTFIRVRGYKFLDDYARRGGFKEQSEGCAGLTVFDPERQTTTSFLDVEEGADFLKMKRGMAAC